MRPAGADGEARRRRDGVSAARLPHGDVRDRPEHPAAGERRRSKAPDGKLAGLVDPEQNWVGLPLADSRSVDGPGGGEGEAGGERDPVPDAPPLTFTAPETETVTTDPTRVTRTASCGTPAETLTLWETGDQRSARGTSSGRSSLGSPTVRPSSSTLAIGTVAVASPARMEPAGTVGGAGAVEGMPLSTASSTVSMSVGRAPATSRA